MSRLLYFSLKLFGSIALAIALLLVLWTIVGAITLYALIFVTVMDALCLPFMLLAAWSYQHECEISFTEAWEKKNKLSGPWSAWEKWKENLTFFFGELTGNVIWGLSKDCNELRVRTA